MLKKLSALKCKKIKTGNGMTKTCFFELYFKFKNINIKLKILGGDLHEYCLGIVNY
jgi:hypothetical protein